MKFKDNELIKLFNEDTYTAKELALKLNVTKTTILTRLKKLDLKPHGRHRKVMKFTDEDLLLLYKKEKYVSEIAKKLNVSSEAIRRRMKILKLNSKAKRGDFRKKELDKNFFFNFTSNSMYVLGLLASDGNLYIKKNGKDKIITFTGELETIKRIKDLIKSEHKIYTYKNSLNSVLKFQDSSIFDLLVSIGITPRKSKTLDFPKIPEDKELIRHFIRGYFDGDGCISITKHNFLIVAFASGSKIFLEKLKQRLSRFKIYSSKIILKKNCNYLILKSKNIKRFYSLLYKDVDPTHFLSRKKEKFDVFFQLRKKIKIFKPRLYPRKVRAKEKVLELVNYLIEERKKCS